MDVSKLPRLSGDKKDSASEIGALTPSPTKSDSPAPATQPLSYTTAPPPGIGAEIWFSAIIGLIFLALGWTFGKYLTTTLSHQPFHTQVIWQTGPLAGTEVGYWDLEGGTAFSDSAIFLMGVALLIDVVCLVASFKTTSRRRAWIIFSLAIMFSVVIYNGFVCVKLLNFGFTPILSLLAIALGGYSIFYQWAMLRAATPTT